MIEPLPVLQSHALLWGAIAVGALFVLVGPQAWRWLLARAAARFVVRARRNR